MVNKMKLMPNRPRITGNNSRGVSSHRGGIDGFDEADMNYIEMEPEPFHDSSNVVKANNAYLNSEVHSSNKVPPLLNGHLMNVNHFDS